MYIDLLVLIILIILVIMFFKRFSSFAFFVYSTSSSYAWGLRFIAISGNLSQGGLYQYYQGSTRKGYGAESIRPIVTLNSSVKIAGGSGTMADPYTLKLS